MLAGLFMGYVIVWSLMNKHKIPAADIMMSLGEKIYASRHLLPVVFLIVVVLGSIYAGLATATEAAGVGVAGALVLTAVQGALTRQMFIDSLLGATRLSCMIALILAGASFLTLAMGFTGLPRALAEFIDSQDLSPYMLIVVLTIFYIVLGCFLDGISMVVLTMAVVLPTIQRAGIDLIWFGIFIVLVVEMAQVTPPVGFNLFVLQGMTGHQITYIGRVTFPFFLLMVVAVALITFFPDIVTVLPQQMMGKG
jgi:C4-dicarboxylate transporter, DctM subunit